ncbi:MAG: DUF1707 domain-containing protein [Propionibacteriaceae bacterium]|nr:DUF1707 domain-containing protein [Propionibacteriaceae bacterium]
MTDPGELRIGHAERDSAVETLREAAGDGRLTLEELDERITVALAARTRGDLEALLADLVTPDALSRALTARPTADLVTDPGSSWQDPLVLTARWDDVVRAGPWEVPPFLEVNPVAGNVKLNFVDARAPHEVIDLHLIGGAGDAVLIVPEGWGVDVQRVEKGMGSLRSSVAARPSGRLPLIAVRGRNALGTLRVRHPNRFDTWQRDRRLAQGGGIVAKN